MNTLLELGTCIIAAEHIVKAEFTAARKGGEEYFDEDSGQMALTVARPAKMDLTLTSTHLKWDEIGMADPTPVFGSESDHVVVRGEVAEKLAIWMQNQAVIVILESPEQ